MKSNVEKELLSNILNLKAEDLEELPASACTELLETYKIYLQSYELFKRAEVIHFTAREKFLATIKKEEDD